MMPVTQERTGFRDEALSRRHRLWGFNCPATDVDLLMVEYDHGRPMALVEYKEYSAREAEPNAIKALCLLANNSRIPFFVVRYLRDLSRFRSFAQNDFARGFLPTDGEALTELEFVTLLYRLRGRRVPLDIAGNFDWEGRLMVEEAP